MTPVPTDESRAQVLREEIQGLLRKEAVIRVPDPSRLLFSSHFFLAPKKGGMWRPIINLRPLNRHIRPPRFRMDTLSVILPRLRQGLWATSVDLTDAYLHVPIHQSSQPWLGFIFENQAYQFRALPFGLSTAPRTFTRLTRVLEGFLRRTGIHIFMYLDDWLILAPSRALSSSDTLRVLEITQELGWLVNPLKSSLTPSQRVTFLGAEIDLVKGLAVPTLSRIQAVLAGVRLLRDSPTLPARAWLVCLGYLASLVDLVPWCRLYMRPLQFHLLAHFRPTIHPLSHVVPGAQCLEEIFQWWLDLSNLAKGVVFPTPGTDVTVTTDASLSGWGATLGPHTLAHQWELPLRRWHINALELVAVLKALKGFEHLLSGKNVLIRTDNTTVVSYLNRQGGTRSLRLWRTTWDIFQWCRASGVTLRASHLPGVENSAADCLSRAFLGHSEWSLLPSVAAAVFQRLWLPEVDLFASHLNHKLPRFYARFRVPGSEAVDASALDWSHLRGFAFPPFALIGRVLEKASAEGCRLLLIAPFWPSQAWFLPLLSMLADFPWVLPVLPDLLTHPPGKNPHACPEVLHLTAWSLSAQPSERRAFRRRLPRWRPKGGALPHEACILRDSECSENGVPLARLLRLRHLFRP